MESGHRSSVLVPRVPLGSQGFEVSAQGLGCMGMSSGYGPAKPEEDMIELITFAVEHGITFLDTADVYGPHTNEILVGKAIRDRRNAVQLATKFGICKDKEGRRIIRGDPEYVRSACEASLQRLDVDCIDLYYQHRVDNNVPIEITVGEMKKLVEEGKVKYLGLSEASASDIRRAHAVHPITAVQVEYSLWTRDVEEDIIPTCRELGIGIVPYSPLGRGFFAGFRSLEGHGNELDMRTKHPRFQGDSLAQNERLRDRVQKIADTRKCSLNQLALAWMHHKGRDFVPIPGTTKMANLESNMGALAMLLTKEEMEAIEEAVPMDMVGGECTQNLRQTWRYNHSPPLASK